MGGGNTGSNEGRGAGIAMVALGSDSVLFERVLFVGCPAKRFCKASVPCQWGKQGMGPVLTDG